MKVNFSSYFKFIFLVCNKKKEALSAFSAFLKSKGAKEKVVTRIMVSRCEVDLMKIRTEFKRLHGRSLYQTISVSNSHKTLYFQYHNDCIVNDVVTLLKYVRS